MADLNLPKGLVVQGHTNLKDFVEVDKLALADYLLSIKNINTGAGGKVNLQNLIKSINSTSDKNLIVQGDDGKLLVSTELFKTINNVSILGSGDVFTPSQKEAINSGVSTNTVSQVETNRANISELDGRMTTAESDINTLKGRTTTAENDIDSLETRMTTAEDNINKKQDLLVSGVNIKTINGNSIVGSGNVELTSAKSGGLPIGTIIPVNATSNYVPDGSLPCDGTEYIKSQFTDLWNNYLSTSLLNTCTYTEYASNLSTYGQCAKFAVDTANNKFRVPLIKDGAVIQQALTDDKLGKSYNAGLPNITGNWNRASDRNIIGRDDNLTGAFIKTQIGTYKTFGDSSGSYLGGDLTFNASLSNPIYGNSDTVQPNAVALRYFVVVANGQINQSMMDWSAWASSLQGKANTDLSNLSNSGKKVIDGQWVNKTQILSSDTNIGVYTLDLSEYLPNDNYIYEVELFGSVRCDNSNATIFIINDTYTIDVKSSVGSLKYIYLTIPVLPTDRTIKKEIQKVKCTGTLLTAIRYRRIGTNE